MTRRKTNDERRPDDGKEKTPLRDLTPLERAMIRAKEVAEEYAREQAEWAKGEDHQAPWRELMILAGRCDR